jgi:hypothetical protein
LFVRDASITANTREHEIKKSPQGSAGNCRHKNTDFAQTLSLLCARREAGAIRSPPKTSIKPVYWNGTHLSVFEFRIEKELGYDLDAAGASV